MLHKVFYETVVSDYGLGAVLLHEQLEEEKVTCFLKSFTRQTSDTPFQYCKQCVAVNFSIYKLKRYFDKSNFTIITNHNVVECLSSIKGSVDGLAGWQ